MRCRGRSLRLFPVTGVCGRRVGGPPPPPPPPPPPHHHILPSSIQTAFLVFFPLYPPFHHLLLRLIIHRRFSLHPRLGRARATRPPLSLFFLIALTRRSVDGDTGPRHLAAGQATTANSVRSRGLDFFSRKKNNNPIESNQKKCCCSFSNGFIYII